MQHPIGHTPNSDHRSPVNKHCTIVYIISVICNTP
jgi:hypothetical protein